MVTRSVNMKTCKTCKWRQEKPPTHVCTSPKIGERGQFHNADPEDMQDVLIYSYDEGGFFWVGPDFGCVHHTPREEDDG